MAVDDALAGETHDEPPVFGDLQVIGLDEMFEEDLVIVLRDGGEAGQRQHPGRKLRRGHLASGGEGGHSLVI